VDRIWLKNYDKGVPAEIDMGGYESLVDYLDQCFQRHPQLPAFSNLNHTLTYQQINKLSANFAAFLQNNLGLKKGDRFAIMLPNLLQYVVAMFGALRAGLVVVNVNPLYTTRELEHQLKDSGAAALIVLANFANVAQFAVPNTDVKHVIVTELGDALPTLKGKLVNFVVRNIKRMVPTWQIPGAYRYNDTLKLGAQSTLTQPLITHDDLAYLQYTGGTTGVSKGAMLTHGNLLANIAQLHAWVNPYLSTERRELVMTALPLYHISLIHGI
jgi:long-chain acyl-CoA synthetase